MADSSSEIGISSHNFVILAWECHALVSHHQAFENARPASIAAIFSYLYTLLRRGILIFHMQFPRAVFMREGVRFSSYQQSEFSRDSGFPLAFIEDQPPLPTIQPSIEPHF